MNEWEATEYRLYGNEYNYIARYNPRMEQWSVTRWPSDKPHIPPMTQILTDDGWKSVLLYSNNVVFVSSEELNALVENTVHEAQA